MSTKTFEHQDDAHVAAEIVRLGKTGPCRCWVHVNPRIGQKPVVTLVHKLVCPVHYPKTSALLTGGRR